MDDLEFYWAVKTACLDYIRCSPKDVRYFVGPANPPGTPSKAVLGEVLCKSRCVDHTHMLLAVNRVYRVKMDNYFGGRCKFINLYRPRRKRAKRNPTEFTYPEIFFDKYFFVISDRTCVKTRTDGGVKLPVSDRKRFIEECLRRTAHITVRSRGRIAEKEENKLHPV
jgi:hypothetical protein